jgi:SAM-dependent methyltransferase
VPGGSKGESVEIIEEMQRYYGKRAPVYDSSMRYDDPKMVQALEPVSGHLRGLLKGRKILEIACGPGFWTQQVSPAALSIHATDYNQSTLDQARQKDLDWDKVTLQRADAYHLPVLQGSFDAALAVDWLAHVPQSRFHEFLPGLHACLEAGSRVVFCDQLPGSESLSGSYDREGNHLQTRELPDGSRCRVIKHFLSPVELLEILDRYSDQVEINTFPQCRRIVVSYTI